MTLEPSGKVLQKHILVEVARYGQIDIECMQLQGDLEVRDSLCILVVVMGACEGDWVVMVATRWGGGSGLEKTAGTHIQTVLKQEIGNSG